MINIIFKNLDKSELAREAVEDRLGPIVEKFSELKKCRINVTLEMQNSPQNPGPDLFSVRAQFNAGKYRGIRVEKSAQNLYLALADVAEHLLEVLNRFGDRARIKERNKARKFKKASDSMAFQV